MGSDSLHTSIRIGSIAGMATGATIALGPALGTSLIVGSKAILIGLAINVPLQILTLGMAPGIIIHGISPVPVPLMFWKISLVCGVAGGAIFAISGTVFLVHEVYEKCKGRGNLFDSISEEVF